MPKVRQANDINELSSIYIQWIEDLGEVKPCKKCSQNSKKEYYDKNFDLSWTQDEKYFNKELSEQLKYIEENRFQGKHYYVDQSKSGSIKVINEPEYKNHDFPKESYRFLNLFKYWNIVEYFFPYKYMTDQPWNEVLSEMIPKFQQVTNVTEYHLAMLELVTKTNDTHAYFLTEYTTDYFGKKWAPFIYKIIDDRAVIMGFYSDSLARLNNLHIGDVITHVNEKNISSVISETYKYIPASNETSKLTYTHNILFNSNSDSIIIQIVRNDVQELKSVATYDFKEFNFSRPIEDKWKILDRNIGYVNTAYISGKDNVSVINKLKDCEAIIFDFRNGTMANLGIANQLSKEKRVFAKYLIPDTTYPGKYYWEEGTISGKKNNYNGKVIVLVNQNTLSQAEFIVMSIQAAGGNVTTIGSQTAGADGNVSRYDFLGGFKTQISGIGIYYPDGTPSQRTGVKIDIEIHPTIQGIREGRDEVLEAALLYIKNTLE